MYAKYPLILLGIILLAGVALGQTLIHDDLRINQVHHFGGDALYCVDADLNPTSDFSTMMDGGGMRLLDQSGNELWFIPAADVSAAMDESIETGAYAVVGSGFGTYGPTLLQIQSNSDRAAAWIFDGFDEHAKPNQLTWDFCLFVAPGGDSDDSDDPTPQRQPDEEPTEPPFPNGQDTIDTPV